MSQIIEQDRAGALLPPSMAASDLDEATFESGPNKQSARDILAGMEKYRIDRDNIKMSDSTVIAKGGQGSILRATLVPNEGMPGDESLSTQVKIVAVKKVNCKREAGDHKPFNAFVHELSIVTKLSHRNVAKLIGFVENLENGDTWMVSPLEANGNVRDFLASGTWEIPERVHLIMGTLRGLRYLHKQQPPICHGDLKSLNILVNSSYEAVITDFGSARYVKKYTPQEPNPVDVQDNETTETLTKQPTSPQVKFYPDTNELTLTYGGFSIRWAAPEVLIGEDPDLPSDMWAFGWICWELITGALPFPEDTYPPAIICKVVRHQLPALRNDEQMSHVISLCSVMTDCWSRDQTKRPNAKQCKTELRWIPTAVPSPPESSGTKVRSVELLCSLAGIKMAQDDLDAVEGLLQEAQTLAESTEDLGSEIKVLVELGRFQILQNKFKEAKQSYRRMRSISAQAGSDAGEVAALMGLGSVSMSQLESAESAEFFNQVQSTPDSMRDEIVRLDALMGQGSVDLLKSKFGPALEAFTEILEVSTRLGDPRSLGAVLCILGLIYISKGMHEKAEEVLRRSTESWARTGWDRGRGITLLEMGMACSSQEKYSNAEDYFTQAKILLEAAGDERTQALALIGLANAYKMQTKYPKAAEGYTEAGVILGRIDDNPNHALALTELGEVYDKESRFNEAEEAYSKALLISNRVEGHFGRALLLSRLASILLDRSQYSKAVTAFTDAASAYALAGRELEEACMLNQLAFTYIKQSRLEEAKEPCQKALAIFTRLGDDQGRALSLVILGLLSPTKGEAIALMTEAAGMADEVGQGLIIQYFAMLEAETHGRMISISRSTLVNILYILFFIVLLGMLYFR